MKYKIIIMFFLGLLILGTGFAFGMYAFFKLVGMTDLLAIGLGLFIWLLFLILDIATVIRYIKRGKNDR